MLLFGDPCAQFYSTTAQAIAGLWQSLTTATIHTTGLPAGNVGPAAFTIGNRGAQISVPQTSGPYIVGFRWCSTTPYTSANEFAAFTDASNNAQVTFSINVGGTISAKLNNGTVLGTTSTALIPNVWAYVELLVNCNSSTGSVGVHINNTSALNVTGINTQSQGTNIIGTIALGANLITGWVQDVYVVNSLGTVNNTYLGDVHISVYNPTGNGTFTDYTPNGAPTIYQSVNSTTPTDSTVFASDSTAGHRMSVDVANTAVTGSIAGVINVARMLKTDTGVRTASLTLTNGVGDVIGSPIAIGTSYAYYTQVQETDPNTGLAWTNSGFNTTQVGVKTVT